MKQAIIGFLSNDSFFGRLMTKVAIVVASNLMFLVFCIPVVTIGPSIAALYYVMLESLYRNHALNPFKTFWKGFKENFKQGLITWLIALALLVIAWLDIRFSHYAGGVFSIFLIGIYVVLVAALILYSYLYPVMCSFRGSIRELYTNAIYFAFKKPARMILLIGVEAGAALLTYGFPDMLPLWAFCWFFFGFGAIAMLGAKLLLPLFRPYQAQKEQSAAGQSGIDSQVPVLSEDDADSLEELRELDG